MQGAQGMKVAWFLGFGWLSIITVVVCGLAVSQLGGVWAWVLYVPLLVVAVYMTARYKLFSTQPWRRVHAKAMLAYAPLASQAYDAAKQEGRAYDVKLPCRGLAEQLFGPSLARSEEIEALLGDGRKAYYKALVQACPQVFVKDLSPERHADALAGVQRDIQASELGPDILIAREIERKHSKLEAAHYLQALLLGKVR